MAIETGKFIGRAAKVVHPVPEPVPPPVVHMELTVEEAKVIADAVYFYWAVRDKSIRVNRGSAEEYITYWHNSNKQTMNNQEVAQVAQKLYDNYMFGI